MAGIAALESVTDVAELEIEHEQNSIAETQSLIVDLETIVSELNFDAGHLAQLEADHATQTALQGQEGQQLRELEATITRYEDTATQVATAIKPIADLGLQTSYQDWTSRFDTLDRTSLRSISRTPATRRSRLASCSRLCRARTRASRASPRSKHEPDATATTSLTY